MINCEPFAINYNLKKFINIQKSKIADCEIKLNGKI